MDLEELKQCIQSEIEVVKLHQEQLDFEFDRIQSDMQLADDKLFMLENQLNIVSNEPNVIISIKDWLPEDQYEQYNPDIQMLFEEDLFFKDWLDWFYEELPYIKDKQLSFTGKQTGNSYSILDLNGLVKVNKKNQEIYVVQGEPVVITLGSCNLFKLLSIYG